MTDDGFRWHASRRITGHDRYPPSRVPDGNRSSPVVAMVIRGLRSSCAERVHWHRITIDWFGCLAWFDLSLRDMRHVIEVLVASFGGFRRCDSLLTEPSAGR